MTQIAQLNPYGTHTLQFDHVDLHSTIQVQFSLPAPFERNDSSMAMPFPAAVVLTRNLTVRMSMTQVHGYWPVLLPVIESGKLVIGDFFTHRLPLSEADRAYRIFANREEGCLKVMLDPSL